MGEVELFVGFLFGQLLGGFDRGRCGGLSEVCYGLGQRLAEV